jgi:hypothetical protein
VEQSSDLAPIEWLGRLGPRLLERRPRIDRWRRYYEGGQDLLQGPSRHRQAFKNFQKTARTDQGGVGAPRSRPGQRPAGRAGSCGAFTPLGV